jgi:hypothetical protein
MAIVITVPKIIASLYTAVKAAPLNPLVNTNAAKIINETRRLKRVSQVQIIE